MFSLQPFRSHQWQIFIYLFIYLIIYLFIYLENERYLESGALANVNSMGDSDGVTPAERQRSFPVTGFHVISRVTRPWDLPPLSGQSDPNLELNQVAFRTGIISQSERETGLNLNKNQDLISNDFWSQSGQKTYPNQHSSPIRTGIISQTRSESDWNRVPIWTEWLQLGRRVN